jgi:hypothetical protein
VIAEGVGEGGSSADVDERNGRRDKRQWESLVMGMMLTVVVVMDELICVVAANNYSKSCDVGWGGEGGGRVKMKFEHNHRLQRSSPSNWNMGACSCSEMFIERRKGN